MCACWLTDEKICNRRGPRRVVTSEEVFSKVVGSCWSLQVAFEVAVSLYNCYHLSESNSCYGTKSYIKRKGKGWERGSI